MKLATCSCSGGNQRSGRQVEMVSTHTSRSSSASVRCARKPATMAPPDVPEMTRGSIRISSRARTTPMWCMASDPPPDRQSAVWPSASCDALKNCSFRSSRISLSGASTTRFSAPSSTCDCRSETCLAPPMATAGSACAGRFMSGWSANMRPVAVLCRPSVSSCFRTASHPWSSFRHAAAPDNSSRRSAILRHSSYGVPVWQRACQASWASSSSICCRRVCCDRFEYTLAACRAMAAAP
mmetsp:Transcript_35096/g.113059  ORF Transcript_35096/g.113059 Transcript_35096/m.113059 type:complete len:239 (+) Transcript_35096:1713-2429(+)